MISGIITHPPWSLIVNTAGERQIIYGYGVENCQSATLTAKFGAYELSTVVSTFELGFTKGRLVHRLAARAMLNQWDTGSYHPVCVVAITGGLYFFLTFTKFLSLFLLFIYYFVCVA